ncbi:DUF6187 family protein [Amycolatopsis rifamycinica]|uniref:DUF6187 family protein n=1 Tax=Amycolatopsis rifamycinica TaxID=287986 RepID=UPI0005C1AE89|nr:DUF6187 family protein [Amycolatopsis rifamycinica]
MSDQEPYDSRFTLPDVDAPPGTEVGVILLGLEPERLLAGLGFARLADDPGLVTQVVDKARHGVFAADLAGLTAAGLAQWRTWRPLVDAEPGEPEAGALRQEWASSAARIAGAVPDAGPAARAYLTACWIRRHEIDRLADRKEDPDVVSEVPAG